MAARSPSISRNRPFVDDNEEEDHARRYEDFTTIGEHTKTRALLRLHRWFGERGDELGMFNRRDDDDGMQYVSDSS